MLAKTACLVLLVLSSVPAWTQDAAHTDGDKYKVLLDNPCVRVLEYRDRPGDKTQQHDHPSFVLYAMVPFQRKLTLPDGKTLLREFKAGDAMYSPAQTHIGENIGSTPTHVLMVEMKAAAPPQCGR